MDIQLGGLIVRGLGEQLSQVAGLRTIGRVHFAIGGGHAIRLRDVYSHSPHGSMSVTIWRRQLFENGTTAFLVLAGPLV